MSLCQADHLSRVILPNVVCLMSDCEAMIMRRPWPTKGYCAMGLGGVWICAACLGISVLQVERYVT